MNDCSPNAASAFLRLKMAVADRNSSSSSAITALTITMEMRIINDMKKKKTLIENCGSGSGCIRVRAKPIHESPVTHWNIVKNAARKCPNDCRPPTQQTRGASVSAPPAHPHTRTPPPAHTRTPAHARTQQRRRRRQQQ